MENICLFVRNVPLFSFVIRLSLVHMCDDMEGKELQWKFVTFIKQTLSKNVLL